jgi:hypothetical protein
MKVRLKLVGRTVEGNECPVPVLTLRVRDRYGALAPLRFRVDPQADFTTVPASIARQEGIPFSEERVRRIRGVAGASEVYRGRLRVVIAAREHDWPCDFSKAAVDATTGRPLPDLTPVLGRAGFLDEYALGIDSGYLILTRLGPLRRWWRRRLHAVWLALGMVHPTEQPL